VSDERMQILRMIEEKQITASEGIKLLEALSAAEEDVTEQATVEDEGEISELPPVTELPPPESEPVEESVADQAAPPDFANFGHLWLIPLAAGAFLGAVGLGAILLVQAASPGSFFLVCGLMPLLLGLAVMGLAFWSRTARWLHVRIHGEQRISVSFPLPLRLTGWILRLVRPYVPQLEETGLDEVILSLDESLGGEDYFYVDVHDDEDGEQVQVFIG
jgi:hypothetical protein